MFNDSKYTKAYFAIISKHGGRKGEVHHIIPRSLRGGNDSNNLVSVTPRVHFILHRLLVKMVTSNSGRKSMVYALWMMANKRTNLMCSRSYNLLKEEVQRNMTQNNPMFLEENKAKMRRQRPEQSEVAKRRNRAYWDTRARPLNQRNCLVCGNSFETRVPNHRFCSRPCTNISNTKEWRGSVARSPPDPS